MEGTIKPILDGWNQMKENENFPVDDFDFVDKSIKSHKSIQHMPLLTATPSRTGFPRGFLWDEGFHNEIICKWDKELCMLIIDHWLNTTFANGWIPRE
jgi:hypothetical protein